MKYLLDTHAFLWLVFDSKKLNTPVKEVIQDPTHEVHVSAVSFWEISLKFSLGKLLLQHCTPDNLVKVAGKIPLEILPLLPEEAASFHQLGQISREPMALPKKEHKDPFDRMIVWQAIGHHMTLITCDGALEDYCSLGLKTLW